MSRPKFASEIELTDSSLIKKVRYDHLTNTLDVKLKSGQSYRYRAISVYSFARLVTLQSSGKVYNEEIKSWSYSGTPRKATKIRSW
ncbi:MAG TPA: KTSC domain-containing protein [Candidatus Paceibacterota bacterium]